MQSEVWSEQGFWDLSVQGVIVNPRKLEHGFRMMSAGIPYTLPLGQEENDVPSFWLLLYRMGAAPAR